ncbi:PQQ-binding-like beta-propeller repeat protein [bacterium]|nr:PQQ-binding-like beta-propeller repeat protein [bacterium]
MVPIVLFSCAQEASFRFAWLSDTHIGTETAENDLRQAVRDINSLEGIEFIIISGDITEMGSDVQLILAKSILDDLEKPYYIIPGNHDTKWSESGCTTFAKLWGADKFKFDYGAYTFIGMHQGPLMRMGDGHFAPEDLRWLDTVLSGLPSRDRPLFFVTHYPINSSVDNWYEFLDRTEPFARKAVLFGHGHRNGVWNFEGLTGIMGRSSLRRDQPAGGFTVVEVRRDSLIFFERLSGRETCTAWYAMSLINNGLPDSLMSEKRPERTAHLEPSEVKTAWIFETGYTIASAPAVASGIVVAGNSKGSVYGLSSEDGTELWHFTAGGAVFSTPDISSDRVVFGSADCGIYCLNSSSGKQLWKFATGAPVVASPRICGDTVFTGGSDGIFRALRLENGQPLWEFSGVGGFVETKPLVYREMVVFGAWDTYVYAVNRNDGSLLWKWSNGNPGPLYSPAACQPAAYDGRIYIVAPDRFFTVLDAASGETLFRSNRHQVREAIGQSANRAAVYVKCMRDTLLAFSCESVIPELLWMSICGYGYDIDPSMPVEKENVISFGTKNGELFAVDSEDGTIRFRYRAGEALINNVVPLDARRFLLTDMDGSVMLVTNGS